MSLHAVTPATAHTAAMMLIDVRFCMTSRQMKMDVMANAAMGSGMLMALPTSTPTTFESAQDVCENMLVMSARSTDQSPSENRAVDMPNVSSVTLAAKQNESHFGASLQSGAKQAE